jgi:hypothetical protein
LAAKVKVVKKFFLENFIIKNTYLQINMATKKLLEQFISSVVKKAIKEAQEKEEKKASSKFDFDFFKTLRTIPARLNYAEKFLQKLGAGTGSSRETFKLSDNRVLKIAKNEAGIAQTEAELEFIRNNSIPRNFTTIEEFDPKGNWIVAELVNPFESKRDFAIQTGINYSFYEDLIKTIQDRKPQNLRSLLYIATQDLEEIRNKISELAVSEKDVDKMSSAEYEQDISLQYKLDLMELEPFVSKLEALLESKPQYNFMMKIMNLLERGLEWGDLGFNHFGKNSKGEILIYDYGFTTDVYKKYYRDSSSDRDSNY